MNGEELKREIRDAYYNDDMYSRYDLVDAVEDIVDDNAKLRELCGFMLRCMKRNHDCDCCLVNGEHCEISYIESDARELGVEVDG